MPEIAEVETLRLVLKEKVLHKRIKKVSVLYERIIATDRAEFQKSLIGLSFDDILRRGKWLLFSIGDYYLGSHLRMEGKYYIKDSLEEVNKHEHVIFHFADGTDLRYHDTRKFGRMFLVLKKDLDSIEGVRKQGIEPISPSLTKEYLYEHFKKKRIPVKSLLLDQTIISGLGNIYSNEVLFASAIHPLKLGCSITLKECERIVLSSKKIIEKAIECGGTTIRSYTSSLGVSGHFQQNLKVHQREGAPCSICQSCIKKIVVGGRSTYFCENCQKN